ncbi:hypothetical protein [Paradevosia shaoguanensis]|uniref:hypothetical protein n=1 Tax=Paradevosia shaoguanensis TaxID=1335043 RepID=UPI000455C429|nr:hypothetical protein [Paradevosia shaoguanensis]MBI4047090.1 hypothetical protein [Devosia nanyangense]CDP51194.1 FIG01024567: hypothetical protein [Devosia sp. DBB001]
MAIAQVVLLTATGANAIDRRVKIINNTGYTIEQFYASSVGQDSWEEDILGRDVLPSGSSVVINVDDGTGYCKYDFRAVFEDGDVLDKSNVNVCEIGSFTYN